MEPSRTYEYLALARQRLLAWVRPLSMEQYTRAFPTGRGTLQQTLTHTMTSEWYYVERLQGHDVPPYPQWPMREEDPPAFAALEAAWTDQAARTRAAIGAERDWAAELEYRIIGDGGRPAIINASAGDIFTQLVLHEVHHRSQAMGMLKQMGVVAEDIDFNTLMYRRRDVPG